MTKQPALKEARAISRLEVIDPTGRVLVLYTKPGGVEPQLQDDGRTLKVFVDKPIRSKTARKG